MSHCCEIYKIQENLFFSGYWPGFDFEELEKMGITAIVNLMEREMYTPPKGTFKYLHKGFPDDARIPPNYLTEILNFIEVHTKNGKVLVHCSMGISRSGGICVAWLMHQNKNWSWKDAVNYIKEVHPVYPAKEIRESVLEYFESTEGKKR